MPIHRTNYEGRPLLDIASHARKGSGRRDHLSPAEIELIARTVNRTPEVMVKVLTRGGQDLGAVRRHFEYLDRKGELDIEADDGHQPAEKGVERELLEDWDLDIEEYRRTATLEARPARVPPKLVHKVLFSMPPGTPPQKVLEAVKNFAREEFALKHRYAMVLHTDEPHPHVHMVVKAVSEQGVRLNIGKATLRCWRQEFARHLRVLGIAANATERAVRGNARAPKSDGVYRAAERGSLRRQSEQTVLVGERKATAGCQRGQGTVVMERTRSEVTRGWQAVSELLSQNGMLDLAAAVRRFAIEMPALVTNQERTRQTAKSQIRKEREDLLTR